MAPPKWFLRRVLFAAIMQGDADKVRDRLVEGSGPELDHEGRHARNTCSGNSLNWEVAAGNACFVVQAIPSPPVTGNSGGVSPGSADPNANFTY